MKTEKISDSRVLAVALRVIMQKGPLSFTLEDVSKKTKLSPAALIKRFGSKKKILDLCVQKSLESFSNEFKECDKGIGSLVRLFEWFSDELASESPQDHLFLLYQDYVNLSMRRKAVQRFDQMRKFIEQQLQFAIQKKQISAQTEVEILAQHIDALLHGAAIQSLFYPEKKPTRYFKNLIQNYLILHGMRI